MGEEGRTKLVVRGAEEADPRGEDGPNQRRGEGGRCDTNEEARGEREEEEEGGEEAALRQAEGAKEPEEKLEEETEGKRG